MQKYQVSNLVLSDKLRQNEEFMESFYQSQKETLKRKVHILDGKGLMPYLIKEIIEYLLQKQGKMIELEDLYLLIKQDSSQYKENISFLSQYFKTITIVTPCLARYQKFANQLIEINNAMVVVTNNKKKSLRRAKWVVNFDMTQEEMKKYTIYRTATILSLTNEEIYTQPGFEGLIISKAEVDISEQLKSFFEEQHLLKQCPITVLYESTITNSTNSRSFYAIKKQMQKDIKGVRLNKNTVNNF